MERLRRNWLEVGAFPVRPQANQSSKTPRPLGTHLSSLLIWSNKPPDGRDDMSLRDKPFTSHVPRMRKEGNLAPRGFRTAEPPQNLLRLTLNFS